MNFTLGENMESLKTLSAMILLFLFCVSVPCFFVPCVLCRSRRKGRDSFSSFQQEVHFLPELEEFLFFLIYLKRSFIKYNLYKVCKTTIFYLCIYFEDFIKNTIYFTDYLSNSVGFLWSYRIWAYLREINIKKCWYFYVEVKDIGE